MYEADCHGSWENWHLIAYAACVSGFGVLSLILESEMSSTSAQDKEKEVISSAQRWEVSFASSDGALFWVWPPGAIFPA